MTLRERIGTWPGVSNASIWFHSRSSRERFLLAGLATLAAGGLLYVAVWRPLASHRDAAMADIARYDALLAEVRLAGQTGLNPVGLAQGEAPSIPDSAASHGLLIRRIEPEGEQSRLSFEDAEFSRILDWIASMESAGIARLIAIQIDRRPAPGTVNAQITLEN